MFVFSAILFHFLTKGVYTGYNSFLRYVNYTECLDLHLSISNDIVSTKIYDKRDDFDFETANFPRLDGDVPRSTSYGVYISQLIRFARASSHIADFNTRNKLFIQKLLKQGYWY